MNAPILQIPTALFGPELSRPQLIRKILQLLTTIRGLRFKLDEDDPNRVILFLPRDPSVFQRTHQWINKQLARMV